MSELAQKKHDAYLGMLATTGGVSEQAAVNANLLVSLPEQTYWRYSLLVVKHLIMIWPDMRRRERR